MRFMMLMIPKGYETAAPGTMPDPKAVAAMMKYNGSLLKAGVLLALDGLHPPSMGARVSFSGGKPTVTDGPFTEAKEVIGGYWIIQVKSREEAIEWASRIPGSDNEVVEVRQVMEFSEFPDDMKAIARNSPSCRCNPARRGNSRLLRDGSPDVSRSRGPAGRSRPGTRLRTRRERRIHVNPQHASVRRARRGPHRRIRGTRDLGRTPGGRDRPERIVPTDKQGRGNQDGRQGPVRRRERPQDVLRDPRHRPAAGLAPRCVRRGGRPSDPGQGPAGDRRGAARRTDTRRTSTAP